MNFLGADTQALRELGQAMAQSSTTLRDGISQIGSRALSVEWHGPDAERFRAAVQAAITRSEAMTDRLAALGTDLETEADDQDRTSEESGEGGQSGPHDVGDVEDPGDDPGTVAADKNIPEDDESLDPKNSGQGQIGDCYLLVTLQSIAAQDPDFMRDHVNEVEPGVYEVTLYDDDGNPVVYRITSVEQDGVRGKDGDQSIYSIYERAYKMHLEAQGLDINGGRPEDAMRTITGKGSDYYEGENQPSLHELASQLDAGNLVTADTGGIDDPSHDKIVGHHAYTVTSVDEKAGTVTVTNPWREGDRNFPKTVTMTYEEYRKTFGATSVGRTRGLFVTEERG